MLEPLTSGRENLWFGHRWNIDFHLTHDLLGNGAVVALKVLHELQHRVSASLSMPQDQHFPSVCQCLCDAVKILSVESMASMSTVALASAGMRMNLSSPGCFTMSGAVPFVAFVSQMRVSSLEMTATTNFPARCDMSPPYMNAVQMNRVLNV
jgi:hypothetical protein